MRAFVKFDRTAGYSFPVDQYKILQNKNYFVFTKKHGNWTYDYIVIKWDEFKMYHANVISHPDDFDINDLPFEEIEGFNFTPGYT